MIIICNTFRRFYNVFKSRSQLQWKATYRYTHIHTYLHTLHDRLCINYYYLCVGLREVHNTTLLYSVLSYIMLACRYNTVNVLRAVCAQRLLVIDRKYTCHKLLQWFLDRSARTAAGNGFFFFLIALCVPLAHSVL